MCSEVYQRAKSLDVAQEGHAHAIVFSDIQVNLRLVVGFFDAVRTTKPGFKILHLRHSKQLQPPQATTESAFIESDDYDLEMDSIMSEHFLELVMDTPG